MNLHDTNPKTLLASKTGYAPSQKLNESELRLVSKLIVRGTNCMRLFLHNNDSLTEAVAKLVDALTGICLFTTPPKQYST